jgi:DNA-binding NarL/FixJ family response regulator
MSIRILLADPHTVSLATLRRLLEDQEDIEVVGQARDRHAAVELTRQLAPEIVLMDADIAVPSGMDAVQQIHQEAAGVKIIILSVDPTHPLVQETFQAGASGYLVKDGDPQELLPAIRIVAEGGTYISDELRGNSAEHEANNA